MSSSTAPDPVDLAELRVDAENPWPGLPAFTEQEHDFFFGRDQESTALFRCVKRDRITLLFGKSGLGKTSLLQAGLFPELRKSGYLPVYIRLNYKDRALSFNDQVKAALQAALEKAMEHAGLAEATLPQADESLWEYVHRRAGNLIDHEGHIVIPVLVFDQFEECFTLGYRKEFTDCLTSELLPALAGLVENLTPASVSKKLVSDHDFARRYDTEILGCKILITLREDYLPSLEALRDIMPSLVFSTNRLQLTEMTGGQALSAVAEPNPDLLKTGVAEYIVRFVAAAVKESPNGEVKHHDAIPLDQLEIAPAILCLFCRQMNGVRKANNLPKITKELVDNKGPTIIDDFYRNCIAHMHPAVRRLIEDQLLTRIGGYRDNIDLAQARADLQRAGADPLSIDQLVDDRLLQIEQHRGMPRLELTHDLLAEPVLRSRDEWREAQEEARQEKERREAQRIAEEVRAKQEQDALAAVAKARQSEEEAVRRARFFKKMVAGIAFVTILLGALLIYGWVEKGRAKHMEHAASEKAKQLELVLGRLNAVIGQEETAKRNLELANSEAVRAEGLAEGNARKAVANSLLAEQMGTNLAEVSSKSLKHCIGLYDVFQDQTRGKSDEFRKSAFRIYENLLMADGHCLTVANQLHRAAPDEVSITDPLFFIPLRAAASALERDDNDDVRKYCKNAIDLADELTQKGKSKDYRVDILAARTYAGAAAMLYSIHDDSASERAQQGLRLVSDVRTHVTDNQLKPRDWDALAQAYTLEGLFQTLSGNKSGSIEFYVDSYNAEMMALRRDASDPDYGDSAMSRSLEVARAEGSINHTDAALEWYGKALSLAAQLKNSVEMTRIFTAERRLLVADKRYDEAHRILEGRIRSLEQLPRDVQRQRDLATAYGDAAEIEEARKQWPEAIRYRKNAVEVLRTLTGPAYDGQTKDLADAYSDLSWAEVFGEEVDTGVADARQAIILAENVKQESDVARIYSNALKSLVAAKHYGDAETLLNERIHSLLASPANIQRQRSLVQAYSEAAGFDEYQQNWTQGVSDREKILKILKDLPIDAYDDLPSDVAIAYGNLSWMEIQAGNFSDGLRDAKAGISKDPSATWIQVNEAHALLLIGQIDEARVLYFRIKDLPKGDRKLSEDIAEDFQQLCTIGYYRPEMRGIAQDLGLLSGNLEKCLAGKPK